MDRIDALRLFTYLAELGSFSAAARRSKVKQSTASKWVAALESELGTNLVQRTTRAVKITPAGRRFVAHADEVLAAFDRLSGELGARSELPSGTIRLSAPVVLGRLFVVPLLADFLAANERVRAELVLGDRYVNLVEEGFDLAIRVGIPTDTSARARKLAESRRVLVASPRYLDAHGRPKTPKDLVKHECLIHGEGNTALVWRFGRSAGKDVPVAVRGRFTANNSEAVLLLARRGLGIALLADWLVEDDLRRGRLVALLEDFSLPSAPVHALYPASQFASASVRALIDHLAASLPTRLVPEPAVGTRPVAKRRRAK